ncbi:MAG: glycosyltransferase [Ignavibacteriaceae bacterium]|nr:glycosyltransferase [Ignavibacterium sp.]MCC6253525.1 glycosyltransferase [Ignavibacteriaceae bacterium]HRN27753.1 glycosyltransferase [Ignavibacteriaceae bacterium]HRP92833.1 glycosyltransferase [Ignavibacteriaceae bacterium]HRQ55390.1 glycosyltransferase [Ignavibacteriaceae bacterium]
MDLSIIIVNYNVKEFLQNLIHSIEKASLNLTKEILIVDNASDDGSVEFIKEKFPQIKLIANQKNLGFGKANNIGLKQANGKYILLINPDTLVAEDTFEKMIKFFESNSEAGLAGCKILNPDGSLQLACRRSFPGPWTSFTKVTGLSNLFPNSKIFARYNLTYLDENKTYEVDAISGSFMMMRKEVYEKVGGFDEQFFMYGEDLDLCYRIQKSGFKVYYVHSTQIIHYKGESTKRSSLDETKVFYNAMHLFVKKHLSSSLLIGFILRSAIAVRSVFAFLGDRKLLILSVILDFILFDVCLFAAEKIYHNISDWKGFPGFAIPIVYTVPALIQIFVSFVIGNYKKDKLSVTKTIFSVLISLPILASLTFFFKSFAFSRAIVLITYAFLFIVLAAWRIIFKIIFKSSFVDDDLKQKKTLIVGLDNSAIQIGKKIRKKKTDRRTVIGLIGFSNKNIGEKLEAFEVIGTDQNIRKIIKENKINEVIFSSGELSYNKMMEIVSRCRDENVEFKIAGNNLDFIVGKTAVTMLDDMPVIDLNYNISQPKLKFIKTLFDYSITIPSLFFIYPFLFFKSKLVNTQSDFTKFILGFPEVVSGKVSLVGPNSSQSNQDNILGKTGLTGYWYIENENSEELEKLNFYYAKNQSIWLDLEILAKSLNKMWSNK